jgi:hypothetical protein
MQSFLVAVLVATMVGLNEARPDFTAYTNGESNSTFAHYDNFNLCAGTYPGPFTDADLGTFHPPRIPDVRLTENTGLGFVTGSGNIYSFDTATDFTAIVPSYNRGNGWNTLIWLQFRTLGSELDFDGLTLSYKDGNNVIQVLDVQDAILFEEILREPDGFGGFTVETVVAFDISYNPRITTVNFAASAPSMSLDQFRVDTKAYVP